MALISGGLHKLHGYIYGGIGGCLEGVTTEFALLTALLEITCLRTLHILHARAFRLCIVALSLKALPCLS